MGIFRFFRTARPPWIGRSAAQRHRAPKARENFGLFVVSVEKSSLHTHEAACDDDEEEHTVETVRP